MKSPELNLTEDEAKKLAAASANVGQHYNLMPSEKTQAWLALVMIIGMTYYPRIAAIRLRIKTETTQQEAANMQAAQGAL